MDAFAGLDGLEKSSNAKNLSLADQLKADSANKRRAASAWDSLDLLDPTFQPTPSPSPSPKPTVPSVQSSTAQSAVTTQSQASQQPEDDVFGFFSSAPPVAPASKPNREQRTQSSQSSSTLSEPRERPVDRRAPRPEPAAKPRPSNAANQLPARTASTVNDRSLAYLVDMGFEPEDATRALNVMDGQVRGAVSYLMAEAQGLPLPKPKQSASQQLASLGNADFSDFGAAASQIGSSMFSKASSLWSKGRNEIEKAYNQYNGQPVGDPDQPAWMRDKAKYDARRSRFSPANSASSSEPDLPSAPRSHAESPRGSVDEQNPMPQRPSRAELFRRKQMERGSGSRTSSVGPRSDTSSPVDSSATVTRPEAASEPVTQRAKPAEPVEPAVDLLNLSGAAPQPQLSSSQSDMYTVSRELGSEAFKKGNYESAVEHYTAALSVVPNGNTLRALLLSNRSAALMKAGNARGALDDTAEGLKLLPNKGSGLEVEGKPMTDIWVKLVTRNAQAAEQMEKFEGALLSYQLLLDNGYATPANLESKRRCQKAMDPAVAAKAQEPAKPMPKRRGWGTTGAAPTSAKGKAALEKVRNEHKQQQEDEKQKDQLRDRVTGRVDAWKAGNETNLRALLATLQVVLWEGSGWTPVPSSDLVVPKRVRIVYMKAVSRTHPDKVPADAPMEVRMISESVFITIQKAWEAFRVENNL